MLQVPRDLQDRYEEALGAASIGRELRADYRKWLRFYLDFCGKYDHPATSSVPLFMAKLAEKNQSEARRLQASEAVGLYLRLSSREPGVPAAALASDSARKRRVAGRSEPEGGKRAPRSDDRSRVVEDRGFAGGGTVRESASDFGKARGACTPGSPGPVVNASRDVDAADSSNRGAHGRPEERSGRAVSWAAQYEELRGAIRMRNYSPKTLDAYRFWIRKFQGFVRSKPAEDLRGGDVKGFLTDLAVRQGVAASTQNQAFNGLLFFYRHVLGREFGKLEGVARAKRRRYVPVVLSRAEVEAVLSELEPGYRLVALLLYGCGLRLSECLGLRVQCFNLDAMLLTVHDGKGQKDRTVPLPERVVPEIRKQMERVRRLHREDLAAGYAGVFLPRQLERKYKNAAREFIWQWFFPAANLTAVPEAGEKRRYHLHDSHVQHAIKEGAGRAGITKRVSPHTFRHTFASHLLLANYDLQTIQRLLGHSDVKTTMIYLQTVPSVTLKEAKSPLDLDPAPGRA
jgi:integron integrase